MGDGSERSIFIRFLPLAGVVFLIVLIYLGIVFHSRKSSESAAEESAKAIQNERYAQSAELNGGTALKILGLTLDPAAIRRGQSSQLCYGVINAKEIHFEPQVEGVWPSRLRCVDVSPKKTTTYKLMATDAQGKTVSAEATLSLR